MRDCFVCDYRYSLPYDMLSGKETFYLFNPLPLASSADNVQTPIPTDRSIRSYAMRPTPFETTPHYMPSPTWSEEPERHTRRSADIARGYGRVYGREIGNVRARGQKRSLAERITRDDDDRNGYERTGHYNGRGRGRGNENAGDRGWSTGKMQRSGAGSWERKWTER